MGIKLENADTIHYNGYRISKEAFIWLSEKSILNS